MKRALMFGLGIVLLGPAACSSGGYPSSSYSGGLPGGYDDDDGGRETDGIDLDGGTRPPPPPPDDDGGFPRPDNHGDCCEGNGSPGCENKPVEQCVCAADEWCCEAEWDQACAALIEQLGCGHCTAGDDGPPPPPGGDDSCCSEHGTPGCADPAVEACVCDVEPYCCENQWSAACTAVLEVHGCGQCEDPPPPPPGDSGDPPPPPGDSGDPPPPGDSGDPPPGGGDGDCCMANGTPGCDDGTIESCVCAEDSYCCDMAWDGVCVGEVDSLGCGTCGGGGGDGSGGGGDGGGGGPSACCQQQAGAGCAADPTVEMCVCDQDAYCCNTFWDLTCAGEVVTFGCGSCS